MTVMPSDVLRKSLCGVCATMLGPANIHLRTVTSLVFIFRSRLVCLRSRLVAQIDLTIAEDSRLGQLQVQRLLHPFEHAAAFAQSDGIQDHLVFIDRMLDGELRDDAAAA